MSSGINKEQLVRHLRELGRIYDQLDGPFLTLGVCGGAALMFLDLTSRVVTKDIDTIFPTPWPEQLTEAVKIISDNYGLPERWMNAGPDILTSMGLPEGFYKRAMKYECSKKITVLFASRYDQIFFKLYAAADRDISSYHVADLLYLKPTSEELFQAAQWCQTHDVSQVFRHILINMLQQLGYHDVAEKISQTTS